MMDKEEISVEEYELLSDEDKAKYYSDCLVNINGTNVKIVKWFHRLRSLRDADRKAFRESME